MLDMGTVAGNLLEIREKIHKAGRGRDIKLIGVTKTVPAKRIRIAFDSGVRIFGENRIQEGAPKVKALEDLAAEWHFIGHLQTNKARDAVRHFSCIQSVDSIKLLREIEKEAEKQQKKVDVMLEVNLGGEASKYGLSRDQLPEVVEACKSLKWGQAIGLMIIPPFFDDAELVRPYFRELRELRDACSSDLPSFRELSMGMSHDFVTAIEEGATMVRIGTAIFGER